MKNNLDFFTHYTEASRNRKFKTLRAKYGYAGQGRFWHLNEIIAESDNCRLDLSDEMAKASLADDLKLTIDELMEFIAYLEERCKLIQRDESGAVTTEQTQEDLSRVMKAREDARERANRRRKKAPTEDSAEHNEGSDEQQEELGRKNMQRSVAYRSVEENSVAERSVTTLDADSVSRELKNVVDLHDGEPELFAWNLSRAGLDAEFLRWFIGRVRESRRERGIRNVKGFIVSFLKDPGKQSSWIAEYEQDSKPKQVRPVPPGSCPHCGGTEFRNRFAGAVVTGRSCLSCGTWVELDEESNDWVLVEETVPSGEVAR